jgi:hypothetical protein
MIRGIRERGGCTGGVAGAVDCREKRNTHIAMERRATIKSGVENMSTRRQKTERNAASANHKNGEM